MPPGRIIVALPEPLGEASWERHPSCFKDIYKNKCLEINKNEILLKH